MSVAELSREGLSTVARLESEAPFQPLPSVELTVVIPTLNEGDNVPLIVQRLNRALAGIAWEAVFVDDDSADGTADAVRARPGMAPKQYPLSATARPARP
jgi:hypothetical protein